MLSIGEALKALVAFLRHVWNQCQVYLSEICLQIHKWKEEPRSLRLVLSLCDTI